MRNVKLTIEYDGTDYHGWQRQTNAITVQAVLEQSVESLTGEKCELIGCSRTDHGVHALGQIATFNTNSKIPPDKFAYALNTVLPEDIVIRKSEEVSMDFHPRFNAKGKKYRYLIFNSAHRSAIMRNRAYHVYRHLEFEAMREAAGHFLGRHDFSAFRASGSDVKTSERTITGVSLARDDSGNDNIIRFEIMGDGFLYNMVRIIVGTLVDVGTGRISPDHIPQIIESRDRTRAGQTAPAQGLYLMEIYY